MSSSALPPGSGAVHVPVMVREVLQFLELKPGLLVVDGTIGAGGHSREITKRIQPGGTLLGLDRDPWMLAFAGQKLGEPEGVHCEFHQASYTELGDVLRKTSRVSVDRVLLDLGLSSDQLRDESRGFSFEHRGPLDLRFDITQGVPAREWLAQADLRKLSFLLGRFSEDPSSHRIARAIVETRRQYPIQTADDFRTLIERSLAKSTPPSSKRDTVVRVFQALRIIVNRELDHLEQMLTDVLPASLSSGGRAVIISFHSLEDRLVKNAFRDESIWQILTPKPITASAIEIRANPRCRTAKLRAAVRV